MDKIKWYITTKLFCIVLEHRRKTVYFKMVTWYSKAWRKSLLFVCHWVYLMLGLRCCRWWRGWSLRLLRFHLDSHQLTDHSLTDNYYTVVLLAQGGWWQATDKSHDKLILMWKKDVLKETTDISTHNSIISISDSACSVVTKASNIMAFNTHQTITVKEKNEYIFMVSEWNETI